MIKRPLAAAVLVGLAGLGLTGCSSPALHGTVTDKQYLAPYTTYVNTPVYGQRCTTTEEEETEEEPGPNGKGEVPEEEEVPVTSCTSYLQYWHLVPYYHDGCYQLTVSGKQGGTGCVSESEYNGVKVGGTV